MPCGWRARLIQRQALTGPRGVRCPLTSPAVLPPVSEGVAHFSGLALAPLAAPGRALCLDCFTLCPGSRALSCLFPTFSAVCDSGGQRRTRRISSPRQSPWGNAPGGQTEGLSEADRSFPGRCLWSHVLQRSSRSRDDPQGSTYMIISLGRETEKAKEVIIIGLETWKPARRNTLGPAPAWSLRRDRVRRRLRPVRGGPGSQGPASSSARLPRASLLGMMLRPCLGGSRTLETTNPRRWRECRWWVVTS